MIKSSYFFILALILTVSCRENDDDDPVVLDPNERKVFVLNEGNFQFGNASISVFQPEKSEVKHFVFESNNSGRPIGDVVQSMEIIDNKGFIVVNNSSKIEVVDISNFKSLGSISPFNSPRYILPISKNKAYVSDLYEGKISIIDPEQQTIIGSISTGGWTEEMHLANNKAFVCHMDSAQILVIDVQSDQIINRIKTPVEPNKILQDVNGNLWVACSGGFSEDYTALVQINPSNEQIIKTITSNDLSNSINNLEMHPSKSSLFYLMSGDLFEISISDSTLPSQALVSGDGKLFYGLGVDVVANEIYVSDAIDYQQHGVVFRYDFNGNQISHFRAGIIPGDFIFYK
tara:strand:+ start:14225 stop:15259 length:1035 start_codon:yes stop_codon:yes gene_type:complete